jgi:REP element-mobilizing transposase RayT
MDYHRRSIRLKGYDYSNKGCYFVTIDLENKKNLFWEKDNKYELNVIGKLADRCWLELESRFVIKLDEYVIMPNHIHGIIIINRAAGDGINRAATRAARTLDHNNFVGAALVAALNNQNISPALNNQNNPVRNDNLGNIIGAFKSIFVGEYIRNVKNQNWPRFYKRLWQRDYYERIIRNNQEYLRIKKYIRENPEKWKVNKCV